MAVFREAFLPERRGVEVRQETYSARRSGWTWVGEWIFFWRRKTSTLRQRSIVAWRLSGLIISRAKVFSTQFQPSDFWACSATTTSPTSASALRALALLVSSAESVRKPVLRNLLTPFLSVNLSHQNGLRGLWCRDATGFKSSATSATFQPPKKVVLSVGFSKKCQKVPFFTV